MSVYNLMIYILKIARKNTWIRISLVYCFVGLLIIADTQAVWIDEIMTDALSGFAMALFVVPAILIDSMIFTRHLRQADVIARIGRNRYIAVTAKINIFLSTLIVAWYILGSLIFAGAVSSEGAFEAGAAQWVTKGVIVLLFMWILLELYEIAALIVKNDIAAVAMMICIAYIWHIKNSIYGLYITDIAIEAGVCCLLFFVIKSIIMTYDFRDGSQNEGIKKTDKA